MLCRASCRRVSTSPGRCWSPEGKSPGDPRITDHGVLNAVSRHQATVFDQPVYRDATEPPALAAVLRDWLR